MTSKLHALCLALCVMLLSACSGAVQTPPPVVQNEVPAGLLDCLPEPEKPSFNTGNNKRDYQNITTWTAQTKNAGADCRSKLGKVKTLLNPVNQKSPAAL